MKNLTPQDFYEARNSLGLSLAQVAKESGINRNYLSNFEKKKYFLDEQAKARLRDYYVGLEPSVFDATETVADIVEAEQTSEEAKPAIAETEKAPVKRSTVALLADLGYRMVDGRYLAPSATEDDFINDVRETMTDIDDAMEALINEPLPTKEAGFFSGDAVELDYPQALPKALEVVKLLARKQLQHDVLQGTATLEAVEVEGSALAVKAEEVETMTVGQFAARLLHAENDWLSELA
jgi:transcriptional regulator with XRE-family HTH domain